MKLTDSTVVITGAASGIGRALALELFVREGCSLILVDHDRQGLTSLKHELKPDDQASPPLAKGEVRIFFCDVGSNDSVNELLGSLRNYPVDVLINCAGVTHTSTLDNLTIEDFERVVQVNLLGAVRVTKGLLKNMVGSSIATVVNISSLAGLLGAPGMSAYSASKFGLIGFSDALRREARGRIRVCTVCPSFVKTNFARNSMKDADGGSEKKIQKMTAFLQRFGAGPGNVARKIARAIKSGKELLLVNPDAFLLYYLNKVSPRTSDFVIGKAFDYLLKSGVIKHGQQ